MTETDCAEGVFVHEADVVVSVESEGEHRRRSLKSLVWDWLRECLR